MLGVNRSCSLVRDALPSLVGARWSHHPDAPSTVDVNGLLEHRFDPDTLLGVTEAISAITEVQREAAAGNDFPRLEICALRLLDDLRHVRSTATTPLGGLAVDLLWLWATTGVAAAAHGSGDGGRAHGWWIRSLGEGYHGNDAYPVRCHRLMLWEVLPGKVGEQAAEVAAHWLGSFYWHSWSNGDLVSLGDALFDLLPAFGAPMADGWIRERTAVSALIHSAQWALRYRPDDAEAIVRALDAHLNAGGASREASARITMFFALTDKPLTGVPQDRRAQFALKHYGDLYTAGDELALRIATCWGRLKDLEEHFDVLADAAAREAAGRASGRVRASSRLYLQGSPYARIGPAIRVLSEGGRSDLAIRLLSSWSDGQQDEAAAARLIVGLTTAEPGTLWSSAGVVRPEEVSANPRVTLDEMVTATGAFQGVTMGNTSNPQFVASTPPRPGVPDPAEGSRFANAADDYLRLDDLRAVLEAVPDADGLVPLPGFPLPLQPLMHRKIGRTLPICSSLRTPTVDRPVRRAAIVGDATATSAWERSTVVAILRAAGIEVDEQAEIDAGRFASLYTDPGLDLLWVSAHGEFHHTHPDRTALHLSDVLELDIDWLAELDEPADGRRLLVLNVCSGGLSATLGGPLGFGLGPMLAGPHQAVISHLWPTHMAVSAAFGVVLAQALVEQEDILRAFDDAVGALLDGRDSLIDRLRAGPGDGPRLAEHLDRSGSLDLSGVEHWGSPTLHT
jgi:hypothetical protein